MKWLTVIVGAFLVVACGSGKKAGQELPVPVAPQVTPEPTASVAPEPSASPPPSPVGDKADAIILCIGPAGVCEQDASRHALGWHLHTLVVGRDGLCYECWDELDNDCDEAAPKHGYRVERECQQAPAPQSAPVKRLP